MTRMAANSVALKFNDSHLRILVPPNSVLFEGEHEILLANLLGFSRATRFSGYELRCESLDAGLVQSVLEHLRDAGLRADLDAGIRRLVQQQADEDAQMQEAIARARTAKNRPIKHISIPGLRRPLKSYQIPLVAHCLAAQNVANFSVPGSGKTAITLAAFALLREKKEVGCIVVIGPRSSFVAWEDEFQACFGRKPRALRIVGSRQNRRKGYRTAGDKELILLTYQMAANDTDDVKHLLANQRALLVLDESHNIKRMQGGCRADAVLALAPYARRRVVLSGTPVPNSLHDLWTQIAFLWPSHPPLGSREQFKNQADAGDEAAINDVKAKLFPLYWRIKKRDLGLPRPHFNYIKVRMKPYQQAIYDMLAARVLSDVIKAPHDRLRLRLWRRARMVRLLQTSTNPALLGQFSDEFRIPPLKASGLPIEQIIERYPEYEVPSKIEATIRLVRKLVQQGEKVLVWTAFVHNIKTLEKALGDLRPGAVFGDVPKDDSEDEEHNRELVIHQFKTMPSHRVLIANPSACAESVSLHKVCSHAVYLDRTFNGAHYMQSLDRIHRIGLGPKDKVFYHILQSLNSIDLVIDDRLETKRRAMLRLLDETFSPLDFESSIEDFSEEAEEEKDFAALMAYTKRTSKVQSDD